MYLQFSRMGPYEEYKYKSNGQESDINVFKELLKINPANYEFCPDYDKYIKFIKTFKTVRIINSNWEQLNESIDDEFINNLIHLLGEKDNINDVTVDNGRLKFNVVDLDKVDLNGIKAIATSGVFVTGNIIKTLFKLDSQVIKQALEKNL